LIQTFSNMLWGFATSADTIEDRASDMFGIFMGKEMQNYSHNGNLIEYFVKKFPKLVRDALKPAKKKSWFGNFLDVLLYFFINLVYHLDEVKVFDIEKYMQDFFTEYDGIDPNDGDLVPRGLMNTILDFYTEKYESDEWDAYTNKEWLVVIPQELWERVVRDRSEFTPKSLPIKIQLKATGKLVEPYYE